MVGHSHAWAARQAASRLLAESPSDQVVCRLLEMVGWPGYANGGG